MRRVCRLGRRWGLLAFAGLLVSQGGAQELVKTRRAAVTPERFPIQIEQIIAAAAGLVSLRDATLRLPAPMTTTGRAPELEVTEVVAWGDRGARVRVACRRHEQCLPFYVAAQWPSAAAAQAALTHATSLQSVQGDPRSAAPLADHPASPPVREAGAAGGGDTDAARPSTDRGSPAGRSAAKAASLPAVPVVLRAGSRATLVLDGGRLHIKVPVVCLESGEAGRTIRVAATDHKQTYSAEVVDGTLLKGTL